MIANDHFAASFDPRDGSLSIRRSDGTRFLERCTACVSTDAGRQSTAAPKREHTVESATFEDRLGPGKRLIIVSTDPHASLELRVEVALYDRRPLLTIELHCTNVSPQDVLVASLEPARALNGEGGALHVPGVTACITNGEMYYDTGRVHAFGAEPPASLRPPLKGVRVANESVSATGPTIGSWWNVGLFSGYDREGVSLGYLENTRALGLVLLARSADNEISFTSESVHAPPITLRPGEATRSNRFALNVAPTPYAALEHYADAVGVAQNARTRSVVNGWCSWFYTLAEVSETEVLRNAELAARELRPLGLEYVQIDEGFQRTHGDWDGNDRFPHGMKWLAERIRGYGFKPGLWLSPYVISEQSAVFREHQDWLVRRQDGSLQRIGNWANESSAEARSETVKRYCLDITHPPAAEWLRDLTKTIARRWGFEMIKIDFMAWSVLAAERFADSTKSSAEVYRLGLEIMRDAAGDSCHILDCGPGNTTVGLIDSMRIEADINYGYGAAAWKQYFQDPACSAAAAAKRYYFHRRTWVNDNDHACLDLLTIPQAQAAATTVALSGGNMISGDRLLDLDAAKLEILKKITPSLGETAVPIDLFDADIPTAFVLHVERPFAMWSVVAFFNPDLDAPIERRFALNRLGLDPSKKYLAFDFWEQRFAGAIDREIVATVEPGRVKLLAVHAATGAPQFLSTSRHVAQGALELEEVRWSEQDKALSGVSLGPERTAHDVFVYLPEGHPWTWGGRHIYFRDFPGYSLKLVDAHVLRVHVRFGERNRVPWKISIGELFG